MHNLAFGIPTVLISLIIFFFSWKYHHMGDHRIALLLLLIGGLFLRAFISADMFLHPWDERYHALVAKNMISLPFYPTLYNNPILDYDYKHWISNHIWLHKQPFALWSMAGSMSIFGVNEIALRLPSIIFSALSILLTYSIGRYFFNRHAAFLGAFLMALNGLVLELVAGRSPTDHIDIAFMFFILLSIYLGILFVKSGSPLINILTGISLGAAILTKWLPALIVIPVWLLIVLDSGKFKPLAIFWHLIVLSSFTVFIFLPWQWYIFNSFPDEAAWESHLNLLHLTDQIEGRGGKFWFYLDKIRINYGELIYLPLIWYIWRSLKNWRNLKLLAVLTWVLVPLIFFSCAGTKMQAYILFISPALFLVTGSFFYWLLDYRKRHRYKLLTGLVLILLIALPVRYSVERTKPFEIVNRNPAWVKDLRALDKEKIQKGILFNYPKPIEAMFYTNLTVYSELPDIDQLVHLHAAGYTILVNNTPSSSHKFIEPEGIRYINLRTE